MATGSNTVAGIDLQCEECAVVRACMKRPKNGSKLCKECFFKKFEHEIHETISTSGMLHAGMKVGIGASGGKDSTVLAYIMKLLNERHNYNVELLLISVDEGITGYRDDSLETVKRNQLQYNMPLTIVSYKELYDWTMDEIVAKVGKKSNCTFCGVFRRQALDRAGAKLGVDLILTGHNADDVAETVLMNLLRGDVARLKRCTAMITGQEGCLPRAKPLKYAYEKEIVLYALYKRLDYFSTECTYSPNSYRGNVRTFIKDLEAVRPRCILDIIKSGEEFQVADGVTMPVQGVCRKCGYMSSQGLCKACILLDGLSRDMGKLAVGGKTPKIKRLIVDGMMQQLTDDANLATAQEKVDTGVLPQELL